MNRREFLSRTLASGVALGLSAALRLAQAGLSSDCAVAQRLLGENAAARRAGRKLLVVQFGGGTRYSESVGDPRHRYIPRLWNDLVPRGTLFSNLRVEGKVVHPNSTASMMTGHWEWEHLDWTQPLAHPSLFEIYRHATGADDLEAWVFAYASILAKVSESSAAGYGPDVAANVVMPPTIPRATAEEMDRLIRQAASVPSAAASEDAAQRCAALARSTSRISLNGLRSRAARDFVEQQFAQWQTETGSTSHDAFLTRCAIAAMRTHAPDVIAVCFGEIDCAHYGSWSRYVEAIARTDALTGQLWDAVQSLEAYRDQTLLLVLPDHGRELDATGGLGFVHHSDFYQDTDADEGCRRVWMVAVGPGVPRGRIMEDPTPITTVAATGLEFLGLTASVGAAKSIWSKTDGSETRTHD